MSRQQTQQTIPAAKLDELDPEQLARFEADFTPRAVVEQGLTAILTTTARLHVPLGRVLDPARGGGVFGQVLRSMDLQITMMEGVEIRDEPAHPSYDVETQDDYRAFGLRAYESAGVRYDLIATNPPFSLWEDYVELSLDLLTDYGMLILLGTTEVMQRGRDRIGLLEECPPDYEFRVAGSIGFRGPGHSTDQRCYSWFVWLNRQSSAKRYPGWFTYQLPLLRASERRWVVRPGTEAA